MAIEQTVGSNGEKVGQVVHYVNANSIIIPALITHVNDDGTSVLQCFSPYGAAEYPAVEYSEAYVVGKWTPIA